MGVVDELLRARAEFERGEWAEALERGSALGPDGLTAADLESVTYYTGHETVIPTGLRPGMAPWRESLFAFMHHNAQRPGAYFKIPSAQIMEIGIEFQI